jgi:hypothetical protein
LPLGRADLPFQCVIPDQFRVLLLVQAVQVFWVRKHFRYSSGSVNLLFMKGDAGNPGVAAIVHILRGGETVVRYYAARR